MKKRDSAYYRKRLARDHPLIFAEVLMGRLSVRAASAKAKLIHLPTRFDALKREWKKADRSERRRFGDWLRAELVKTRGTSGLPITDPTGHLRPDAAKFLSDWVKTKRSKPGRILKEIGRSVHDWRLANAVDHGTALPREIIDKLGPWMLKHGFSR